MTINFKNYYTLEDYKKMIQIYTENKGNYEILNQIGKIFNEKLIHFLKDIAKNDQIKLSSNSENHDSNNLNYFRNLLNNKLSQDEEKDLSYVFSTYIGMEISQVINNLDKLEENYEKLIEKINGGNFAHYELNGTCPCFGCGENIKLIIKNWKVIPGSFKLNEQKKYEFKPLENCVEDKLYEVKVEFKTGKLFMADWFRIEEFTKAVQYDGSINSIKGQIKSTEHAAKLGFITVHVGNSSPTIYQKGEEFLFGYQKENMNHEYHEKGYICTDLWNVTIIDKLTLIEIIAQKVGEEKAQELVKNYIKENGLKPINVSPGTYIIEYNPKRNINKYAKEIPKDINTIFRMKKEAPPKKLKMR